MLTILIFLVSGVLDTQEVLNGFSNEKIVTIVVLILITSGIRKNYQIELLFDKIFKASKSYRGFLFRMMSQTAVLSSFINNTPVVALMTPYVVEWGKKNNIAPSKLLIPLSFATIMGGMITIIGTSTTMVLYGFIEDFNEPNLKNSDLLITGIVVAVTGILFLTVFGHRLLPNYKDLLLEFSENKREYVVETRVHTGSKLIDKSVGDAGLRNLKGVYLVEIVRKERIISPVAPEEVIKEGDVLMFAGNTNDVVDLTQSNIGIDLPTTARSLANDKTEVIEAVVNPHSSIIGQTVKECQFRNRYNAAIIAVHRNGERVGGKIGEIEIQAGDLLLVFAGEDFRNRVDVYRDLLIISKLREIVKPGKKKIYALITIITGVLFLLLFGKFSLLPSLLIILTIMVAFSLITVQDVKRELDLNMITILVFSLAIGQAIIKTGAGEMIGDLIINVLQPFGNIAILVGMFMLANILTSFITNVGAISISFPIAYAITQSQGIDGMPYYLAIAYAASAAFLTPIGYQTNLIVYGPGGYTFKDFLKIGFPVNMLYSIAAVLAIIILYRDVLF